MLSFVLVVFIMAASLFIQGCQFFQDQKQPTIDEQPLERRIGVIKSLGGIRTSNQGTHLLQLDDGSTILLKSLQINLDDPQYAGKTVDMRGILTYTTDQKQIMEVMNIDVVEEAGSQQVNAPSWKDYSNTEIGFNVKYRDDLRINSSDGTIAFEKDFVPTPKTQETLTTTEIKPVIHKFEIGKMSLGKDETLLTTIGVKSEKPEDLLAAGITKSKIGEQSLDAYKKTENGVTKYYVEIETSIYEVTIDVGSDETSLTDQNLFYEMLSSLKLADESQSSDLEKDVSNNQTSEVNADTDKEASQEIKLPAKSGITFEEGNTETKAPEIDTTKEPGGNSEETSKVTDSGNSEESNATATVTPITGYISLSSDSFKFTMQYPKNWYYSGTASQTSGVLRHYDFGTKPLEEVPGIASMDIMTGSVPSGTVTDINGKSLTKVSSGTSVEIYVKGSGSKIYKFTGPSSQADTLAQMASTIAD